MKVRDLIKRLEREGWQIARIRGSHRQFLHSGKPDAGTLTIAGHNSDEVPKGTLNAILKQAGLKLE